MIDGKAARRNGFTEFHPANPNKDIYLFANLQIKKEKWERSQQFTQSRMNKVWSVRLFIQLFNK
jgi:hypothetical protein